MFSSIFCFYSRIISVEIYTERLLKFQTFLPSVSTVFVGLFCKRCQRSLCFQMHLSMLCTCWYLRICKSFLHFSSCSTTCLCAGIFCQLDTVFATSLPPFLPPSATRGALVLKHNPTIFADSAQTEYCTTFHCSCVRPCVRVSQAWHLTFLTYIKAYMPC